jgi:hypothetical protein
MTRKGPSAPDRFVEDEIARLDQLTSRSAAAAEAEPESMPTPVLLKLTGQAEYSLDYGFYRPAC